MKIRFIVVSLILFSSIIFAFSGSSDMNTTIVAHAVRTKEPIIVDGILSEPVWQNDF